MEDKRSQRSPFWGYFLPVEVTLTISRCCSHLTVIVRSDFTGKAFWCVEELVWLGKQFYMPVAISYYLHVLWSTHAKVTIWCLIGGTFLKNGPNHASFSLFSSFQYTVDNKHVFNINIIFLPMTVCKPPTSGIRSDRSTKWATTTAIIGGTLCCNLLCTWSHHHHDELCDSDSPFPITVSFQTSLFWCLWLK